ncbi:unnamed protein product, partial [Callosobruchus maculatus]
MHFSQAVAIIQSQVGIIKGVQVLYSDTKPLEIDLVINLPQDGIRLFFDPVTQRLKIIEIYSMKLVKLNGLSFNSPEVLPSIEQIEHSFGATHPGVYDSEKQLFMLNFRGLSFYFPVESKFQTGSTHNLGSLQFPPGNSPLVSRMAIYCGPSVDQAHAPEMPLACFHGQLYLLKAEVLRGDSYTKGLELNLDVLFDARTHLAKKLVLHTNFPGHYNFNMYARCELELTLAHGASVTAYSRWDEVCKQLTPSERPVVLNRASSTNTTNPFGSTLCYGYQDIVFEVS